MYGARVFFYVCVGLLCLATGPAQAERLGKGRSLVLVGISGHRGQFIALAPLTGSPDWLTFGGPTEVGEVGGEAAYYRFLSDHWTLGLAARYHANRVKTEHPDGFESSDIFHTRSFTLRIGGDRYAFIDDGVALYAGPGVFMTRGRESFQLTPPAVGAGTRKGPYSTERGFNGRIGMYARLAGRMALFGHIGQSLSYTSAKSSATKWIWWSSTHEGSVGLAFDF